MKVAEVAPPGIFTLAGTVAAEPLEDKEMTKPPVGATDVSVTLPVLDLPPTTDVGLRVSDLTVGG